MLSIVVFNTIGILLLPRKKPSLKLKRNEDHQQGFHVRLSLEEELAIKYVVDDIEGIEVVSTFYCFSFRNACNACDRNKSSLKSDIAESNSFSCSAMTSSSSF